MKRHILLLFTFCIQLCAYAAISPVKSGAWNDASIWPNNQLPGSADEVSIPTGLTVTMTGSIQAKQIEVMGTLRALNGQTDGADFDVMTRGIMVMNDGLLEIGTEQTPYLANGLITLIGTLAENNTPESMGTKLIGGMLGSSIELHGAPKRSWTTLNVTAQKGSNTITLKEAVDWEIGDEIVIATTDYDFLQSEKRTITSISSDKKTFVLNTPLQYMHYGVIETYSNDTRTFALDMRAEVGLLSRNIKIQGNASSETDGFGGHMMFMKGCVVHAENIELYRMGQKSLLARYPFHWHLAGNVNGQYIKNSSIHRSYNRIITIHGTNNALLEGNVGYDHIGHGYFLEDGDEEGNVFKNNLGILTRAPKPGEEVRPHDRVADGSLLKLPATYWITNPNNDFIGNVAAGSEGSGFWMVVLDAPVRTGFWTGYAPGKRIMGKFDDNKSHSTSFSNFAIDGGINATSHNLIGGHYRPENTDGSQFIPIVNRFTGYKCQDRNVWMRANTMHFYDCKLAESSRHTFFSYNQIIFNSLLVGKTNNIGTPVSTLEKQVGRTLPYPNESLSKNAHRGHSIYDGSCGIVDCHFAGYDDNGVPAYAFQTNGAAQKSTSHYAKGITFDPATPMANKVDFTPAAFRDYMYASGLFDQDGSITGVVGARLTPIIRTEQAGKLYDVGFNSTTEAVTVTEWGAHYDVNTHYGLARLNNKWDRDSGTPIYAIRSDGYAVYNRPTYDWYSQNPVIVNEDYVYYWQYHKLANRIDTELKFANQGDSYMAVFPNVPSSIRVSNSQEVLNETDLKEATQTSHFLKDNSLYLKIVAETKTESRSRQFSREFEYSGSAQICVNEDCSDASGRTSEMILADFEVDADTRGSLSSSGDLNFTDISGNGSNRFDLVDHSNSFSFSRDADNEDEYLDYRLDFDRQVWTDFKSLSLRYDGLPVEVLVVDQSEGENSVGVYNPLASDYIKLDLPANQLDEVIGLVLRFYECTSTGYSTIKLRSILLSINNPSTYSAKSTIECREAIALSTVDNADFSIYPNPAKDRITIISRETYRANIFNLGGQLLLSIPEEQVSQGIDVSTLKKGVYLIEVTNLNHKQRKKLIIK